MTAADRILARKTHYRFKDPYCLQQVIPATTLILQPNELLVGSLLFLHTIPSMFSDFGAYLKVVWRF